MRRLLVPMLVLLNAMTSIPFAAAESINPPCCSVNCSCAADPMSGGASGALPLGCTISPSGGYGGSDPSDDIRITVVVANVLCAPLSGATVIATPSPIGGSAFLWDDGSSPAGDLTESPQTGVTDLAGATSFNFDEGGVGNPAGERHNLDFVITAQGPGEETPTTLEDCDPDLTVRGYDMNVNGSVDLLDFAVFASEFGSSNSPADFDHSGGAVGLLDFALFAANYGADIADQ